MIEEIGAYIRHHEAIIAPLHKDYSLRSWDLSLAGNNQELEKQVVAAKERYLRVYSNREEFRQLRAWKSSGVQLDELEARQFRLIHDAFVPNQIEEDVLRDIIERETQI